MPSPPISPRTSYPAVVDIDEARSPLLFHAVRPHYVDSSDEGSGADSPQRPMVPTTAIQYVESISEIEKMFRFDLETLGLFGTARQRQKRHEKIDSGKEKNDKTPDPTEKKKNSHTRAVIHNALDLRSMGYKVVKIIEKDKLPASSGGDRLWRRLCHKLLRVTKSYNGLMHVTDVIETDTTFYLISERLQGGELFEFLLMERAVPEELCKYLIKQILHALDFLHSNSLLHRDVKPENLMFRRARPSVPSDSSRTATPGSTTGSLASTTDSLADRSNSGNGKVGRESRERPMTSLECSQNMSLEELRLQFELAVIDFDTCKMTDVPSSEYREICNGRRRLVGTYGYLAPEVLKGHEYTVQSDLWSVGVILYILMTGVPPVPMDLMVNARAALEVLQEVKRRGIDFKLTPFSDFPKAQDLCTRLLEFDPLQRIGSARDALGHPWLYPSASNAVPFNPFSSAHPSRTTPDPYKTPDRTPDRTPAPSRFESTDKLRSPASNKNKSRTSVPISFHEKTTDIDSRRRSGSRLLLDSQNRKASGHLRSSSDSFSNSPPPLRHTMANKSSPEMKSDGNHRFSSSLLLPVAEESPTAKSRQPKKSSPLLTPSSRHRSNKPSRSTLDNNI